MIEVYTNKHRAKIEKLYLNQTFQFPFIHSTICGLQNGRIWTDHLENPTSAFICHDFGWSQIIGFNDSFICDLKRFIFEEESFSSFKIRAFCPEPKHISFFRKESQEAERQQFRLLKLNNLNDLPGGFTIKQVDKSNSEHISVRLGLDFFARNWPSRASFDSCSFGFAIFNKNNEVVSVCYSCACLYDIHEIDIFTHEEYRGRGLAKIVCSHFIDFCLNHSLIPNWDCFTNNAGSMALAKRLGFTSHSDPYPFFTYNRKI